MGAHVSAGVWVCACVLVGHVAAPQGLGKSADPHGTARMPASTHSKQAITLCSPAGGQQQQHVITVSFSPFMVVSSWPSDRSEEYAWMSGITW